MTAQTATATTKIPFHGGKSKPSGDGLTTRTNLVDDKFWEITPSATDDDPAAFVTTWLVPAGDLSITIPTCPTTNTDCTNLSYSFPMTIPVPIDFVVVAHTSCRDCNAKVTSWNKPCRDKCSDLGFWRSSIRRSSIWRCSIWRTQYTGVPLEQDTMANTVK